MKLSVSLPDQDVAVLDEHARRTGLRSRSAAVHDAVQLLSRSGLEDDYQAAFSEWDRSGEREAWASASTGAFG